VARFPERVEMKCDKACGHAFPGLMAQLQDKQSAHKALRHLRHHVRVNFGFDKSSACARAAPFRSNFSRICANSGCRLS
jgi:hypothetical protein